MTVLKPVVAEKDSGFVGQTTNKYTGVTDGSESPSVGVAVRNDPFSAGDIAFNGPNDSVSKFPVDDGNNKTASYSRFDGGNGYDMVVLPGSRDDYFFELPSNPAEYPSLKSGQWADQNSMYGGVVTIKNIKGDSVTVSRVEAIAFDENGTFSGPKAAVKGELANIPSDSIVSIDEAVANAKSVGPEHTNLAKLAASREVAKAIENLSESDNLFSPDPSVSEARGKEILGQIQSPEAIIAGPEFVKPAYSEPVSRSTLEQMGVYRNASPLISAPAP